MCQFNRNYRPCDDDKIVVSGYGGGDFVAARYNAGVGLDQRRYVQQDANFNVTSVSNGNSVLERYRYTPYGQRTVLNNDFTADLDNTSDYGFDAGHQGLKHDAETGLIYNRARMLHPTLGRFTSRDPLIYVDWMSFYQLEESAPVNNVDPSGDGNGGAARRQSNRGLTRFLLRADRRFQSPRLGRPPPLGIAAAPSVPAGAARRIGKIDKAILVFDS